MLGSWDWLRGLSIAPGGGRLMFYLVFQDDPAADGIYALDMQPGAQAEPLPFFGAWRWRDATTLYYLPFDPVPYQTLHYYDLATGEDRTLTDTPFRSPTAIGQCRRTVIRSLSGTLMTSRCGCLKARNDRKRSILAIVFTCGLTLICTCCKVVTLFCEKNDAMIEQERAIHPGITESLGIQGWSHLDAVLLAALATESPLLLVGPHGTAKSLLVEKIANALALALRHYNASLINYDDLVGIPLPEAGTNRLQFVTTPGAIWDAEFVFFDEISRCRPDLQNKMFPIVHERRIAGIRLDKLRHRWAAMNPPAPEDPDTAIGEYYLGSEPLDPALVDRFPFVVPVPNWRQLRKEDRRRLVMRGQGEVLVLDLLAEQVEACAGADPGARRNAARLADRLRRQHG